jgi:hypothetical protein
MAMKEQHYTYTQVLRWVFWHCVFAVMHSVQAEIMRQLCLLWVNVWSARINLNVFIIWLFGTVLNFRIVTVLVYSHLSSYYTSSYSTYRGLFWNCCNRLVRSHTVKDAVILVMCCFIHTHTYVCNTNVKVCLLVWGLRRDLQFRLKSVWEKSLLCI